MKYLDLSLATAAQNLALDDALLAAAEAGEVGDEVLRVWEQPETCVVIGRSSKFADEVNVAACQASQIPVFRRTSGGASVVTGPGCFMYSLLLSYDLRPHFQMLDVVHKSVMEHLRQAIEHQLPNISMQGTCDLTWNNRKFSGNALRCKRKWLLYHGTVLYRFELSNISRYLGQPARQPDYRRARSHDEFVTNIPVDPQLLKHSLAQVWNANANLGIWPQARTEALAVDPYANEEWLRSR